MCLGCYVIRRTRILALGVGVFRASLASLLLMLRVGSLLAVGADELAGVDPVSPGSFINSMLINIVPLVLMVAVFFFVIIRPQRQRQMKVDAMLSKLRVGDKVVTSGGIVGIVEQISDDQGLVVLRLDDKAKFTITMYKTAIAEVVELVDKR